MNKKRINELIPEAYKTLNLLDIAKSEEDNYFIEKSYRSALASFGSAVIMGSPISAIAYFDKSKEKTEADRRKILLAIIHMFKECYSSEYECADREVKEKNKNAVKNEKILKNTSLSDYKKYSEILNKINEMEKNKDDIPNKKYEIKKYKEDISSFEHNEVEKLKWIFMLEKDKKHEKDDEEKSSRDEILKMYNKKNKLLEIAVALKLACNLYAIK